MIYWHIWKVFEHITQWLTEKKNHGFLIQICLDNDMLTLHDWEDEIVLYDENINSILRSDNKNSYECRDYESVDYNGLFWISQKS